MWKKHNIHSFKPIKKDDIPLYLSKFIINNYEMKRIYHVPEGFIRPTRNIGRAQK